MSEIDYNCNFSGLFSCFYTSLSQVLNTECRAKLLFFCSSKPQAAFQLFSLLFTWISKRRIFLKELNDAVSQLLMVNRERFELVKWEKHLQQENLKQGSERREFEEATLCSSLSGSAKPLMIDPRISRNSATPLWRSVS